MEGTIHVDMGELYHLSSMLGQASVALEVNDQCPDDGQVGNPDVHAALTHFFGNWRHKRLDLVERLQKLSQGVADAATQYQTVEKQLTDAFSQSPNGSSGSTERAGVTAGLMNTARSAIRAETSTPAGASHGRLDMSDRTWQQAKADYDANWKRLIPNSDSSGPDGIDRYQCVSWAWYRMKELGYTGQPIRADGGEMAHNLGGTSDTVPRLGAVISTPGHVMIAEEITKLPNGHLQVRVSEMNTSRHVDGSVAPDYTKDGQFIPASADEYRSSRTMEFDLQGKLIVNGTPSTVTTFNPAYPAS